MRAWSGPDSVCPFCGVGKLSFDMWRHAETLHSRGPRKNWSCPQGGSVTHMERFCDRCDGFINERPASFMEATSKDVLLAIISRLLRTADPDHAEQLIAELERQLQEAKPAPRAPPEDAKAKGVLERIYAHLFGAEGAT